MKPFASPHHRQNARPRGLTLIELLVVMAIILLLSAAVLPSVFAVLNQQEMLNATQLVQSTLAGVRDTAIRSGKARGVRLLLDPEMNELQATPDLPHGGRVAANRMVFLEPAPNHSEGRVTAWEWFPYAPNPGPKILVIREYKLSAPQPPPPQTPIIPALPQSPTGWYYNIRQGDKIRLGGSGHEYTIVGPMHNLTDTNDPILRNFVSELNPERFINLGPNFRSIPVPGSPSEVLFVMNGIDDDGDGYIDEAFDGINNDGSPVFDPGFNGIVTLNNMLFPSGGEYEEEQFIGNFPFKVGPPFIDHPPGGTQSQPMEYVITRRPMVSPDSREITLPGDVVIDLTTTPFLGSASERSRVPMDPTNGYVDIMIYPNGQVIPSTPYGNYDELTAYPFYHLWITKREDVIEPLPIALGTYPKLPLPQGALGWQGGPNLNRFLQADRRLITLSTRTGLTTVNQLPETSFDVTIPNLPFLDAQAGRSSP